MANNGEVGLPELLKKLDSDKATYLETLSRAHDAVARSLRELSRVDLPIDENGEPPALEDNIPDSGSAFSTQLSLRDQHIDAVRPEQDPLMEQVVYSDDDLDAFLSLRGQISANFLTPPHIQNISSYFGKYDIDPLYSLDEIISKLLEPLPMPGTGANAMSLHIPRSHRKAWTDLKYPHSSNVVWFKYLDENSNNSWRLYHDTVPGKHAPHFWEIIRVRCSDLALPGTDIANRFQRVARPDQPHVPCGRVM